MQKGVFLLKNFFEKDSKWELLVDFARDAFLFKTRRSTKTA